MRTNLSAAAAILSVIAGAVSLIDDAQEASAFFLVAAVVASIQAAAAKVPFAGPRRRLSRILAWAWVIAVVWIDALLVMYQSAARPTPEPEATYLGLTATAFHVIALHAGAVLVLLSAYVPERWVLARWRRATTADS